jgi:hypothetical protein
VRAGGHTLSPHWGNILGVLDALLVQLKENHVPAFLVWPLLPAARCPLPAFEDLKLGQAMHAACMRATRLRLRWRADGCCCWRRVALAQVRKLFQQLFSFVNVQLFNQLLLRRECCSFSNGEYVKTGLAEVETWIHAAGKDWVGESWDELRYIRQVRVSGFLGLYAHTWPFPSPMPPAQCMRARSRPWTLCLPLCHLRSGSVHACGAGTWSGAEQNAGILCCLIWLLPLGMCAGS